MGSTDTGASQRVLAVHRYYWPDTPPYAAILRAIVSRWAGAGHQIEVMAGQPSYKPSLGIPREPRRRLLDGVLVRRVNVGSDRDGAVKRIWNTARLTASVVLRVLGGRRYDVVMCSTAPPVVLAAGLSWAARVRGAHFVYHCMDIHPEIGSISGEFRASGVFRLLRRIDLQTCRRSAAIVVLSGDMGEALLDRDRSLADRIHVINNFDLPEFAEGGGTFGPTIEATDRIRLVFAGNLGRFQGLESLVHALTEDDPLLDRLQLVLMGDGAVKDQLQRTVASVSPLHQQRFRFLEHGTPAAARALVRRCQWGVVSLTPGVVRYAYPSKTATYLSEGVPVLALVEPDSELARSIDDGRLGVALPLDDPAAIASALRHLASVSPAEHQEMQARCLTAWAKEFAAESQLPRWDDLLTSMSRAER